MLSQKAPTGNPAAVCLLEAWPEDSVLQRIATENNLSETAFVVRQPDGLDCDGLPQPSRSISAVMPRWLRPACCSINKRAIGCVFTCSGALDVTLRDGKYTRIFRWLFRHPSPRRKDCSRRWDWLKTQVKPQASDIIVVIDDEALLDALKPDFNALNAFNTRGVVVTAASRTFDFRSRWFGPGGTTKIRSPVRHIPSGAAVE